MYDFGQNRNSARNIAAGFSEFYEVLFISLSLQLCLGLPQRLTDRHISRQIANKAKNITL